MLARK
jgi:hypothetical protein